MKTQPTTRELIAILTHLDMMTKKDYRPPHLRSDEAFAVHKVKELAARGTTMHRSGRPITVFGV